MLIIIAVALGGYMFRIYYRSVAYLVLIQSLISLNLTCLHVYMFTLWQTSVDSILSHTYSLRQIIDL